MEQSCLRCGTSHPLSELDIVGNGYRCAACSLAAEVADRTEGIPDLDDNMDIAAREEATAISRSAWRGAVRRGIALGLVGPAALLAAGSVVAAVSLAGIAAYVSLAPLAEAHASWKRFRKLRSLPTARLRK